MPRGSPGLRPRETRPGTRTGSHFRYSYSQSHRGPGEVPGFGSEQRQVSAAAAADTGDRKLVRGNTAEAGFKPDGEPTARVSVGVYTNNQSPPRRSNGGSPNLLHRISGRAPSLRPANPFFIREVVLTMNDVRKDSWECLNPFFIREVVLT